MKKSDSTTFVAIILLVLLACSSARAESFPTEKAEQPLCPTGYELQFPTYQVDGPRCLEVEEKLETFPRFYSPEETALSALFDKAFLNYLKERK